MPWDRRVEDMARNELEHHALTLRVQVGQYQQVTSMLMEEADNNARLERLKWEAALNTQIQEKVVPGPTESELHLKLRAERTANWELAAEVRRLQSKVAKLESPWWRRLFR